MEFHILCATDDNYAQHCGALISSIFSNNINNEITVHIIISNLCNNNQLKLKAIAQTYNQKIEFHYFNSIIIDNFTIGQCGAKSLVTYYRIFIASIIKDPDIKKILYLDCDIIVNRDISDLFLIDMRNYPIAAVQDLNNPTKESHRFNICFEYRDKYFNAGVLLINLELWRVNDYEYQLIQFCSNDKLGYFADQDALNFVFKNKWLELAPYWNRFSLVEYRNLYFKTKNDELIYIYKPFIIHYASPAARPWIKNKFIPFRKLYLYYLNKTPWKEKNSFEKINTLQCFNAILHIKAENFLYRSPLLIRIFLTFLFDIILIIFHIIKHRSLRYYSPYKLYKVTVLFFALTRIIT